MTNKFKQACADCGKEVPARMGTLSKEGRRWTVRCCGCSPAPARGGGQFVPDRFDLEVEDRMAEACGLGNEQSGW